MNNSTLLNESLLRKSEETQLELADAIAAVSKASVTSILAMESLVANEDTPIELRLQVANDLLSRVMPARVSSEGAGAPDIDLNQFKQNFLKEVEQIM